MAAGESSILGMPSARITVQDTTAPIPISQPESLGYRVARDATKGTIDGAAMAIKEAPSAWKMALAVVACAVLTLVNTLAIVTIIVVHKISTTPFEEGQDRMATAQTALAEKQGTLADEQSKLANAQAKNGERLGELAEAVIDHIARSEDHFARLLGQDDEPERRARQRALERRFSNLGK